ncbi:hypothetical protein BD779DRAFT_1678405 [Infundibulicybe gibba]|nr:hypothetical protein BD779DRAFT_1678405 [Infundibulicybe gibba]
MFARTSAIQVAVIAMIPLLAAATAVPRTTTPTTPASQCNTGGLPMLQFQPRVIKRRSWTDQSPRPLGSGCRRPHWSMTCSPISAIGLGGNSCSAQPVCCSNNSFNGIVALGCTPVNLNL